LIIYKNSPQLTSRQNTDRTRITSSLVKYIKVYTYSQQIYTTTHKNKLESTQLKTFLPHFRLQTWSRIIYAILIPSSYINLDNTKWTNKIHQNRFPCCLELWLYPTPLIWYEQESLGHKAHFEASPRALCFLRLFTLLAGSKSQCASVLQVGTRVYKHRNSALLSSLNNSLYTHTKNVLLLRNVSWHSLSVASTCNLPNQTYILTANLKSPPRLHTNTSYTYEITTIHYKYQNSKHKPNVNYFLFLHALHYHILI
jgi:hypothetical protein